MIEKMGAGIDNSNHDLYKFFKRANDDIAKEYSRICERVSEDPGTAGDQGEENWKELLSNWLPQYFPIVTKGRIIGENGLTSPQVDLLVLSPDYPRQLLNCKEYLSGGVLAAFECKTTLRTAHLEKFMINSAKIKQIGGQRGTTLHGELNSNIYYGLLAHSHSWNKKNSRPVQTINNGIYRYDKMHISHPYEMPDIICIADLTTWSSAKFLSPKNGTMIGIDDCIKTVYFQAVSTNGMYTPVGELVFNMLDYLAWDYVSIRKLVSYMRKMNIAGSGQGDSRTWNIDCLSKKVQKGPYTNGGFWNEWNICQ
ncbi:DUF6602 domain-containing protein [Pseudobutyrivibrio xylanivorans]|uniref:DUF6602 domain-containing protein n=1 Tax=Pseudobutyrivibrio xylanivorans DSM 14809 TaxID=1123012 RepID=A0A1M6JF75_PSEXY|nr:DUF6602 domain-containing protein [Pseudobutyrivibrio xylanivorans]SHJ45314.1 hypothetical protein SAMN02745725_02582 [Pseudobutyrivibrio xylanivorans DSM 14809]